MNFKKLFCYISTILLTIISVMPTSGFAQTGTFKYSNEGLKKGTIESQFQHLNYISRTQPPYKLIRSENLDIIRQNIRDSITVLTKEIATLKSSSSNVAANTKALQDSLGNVAQELQQEQAKTDSISFLGIPFSKSTYHMLVWTLIIVFGLLFLIMLASFRKAKVDTVEHKKTAEQVQDELQTLRKKSIENEQKLRRQLQDELNKRL
ncbi:hypothetical protein [Sphingobacterium sp. SYP-B4668]|uniref:hypothetical protein n=1 Tax=Sphingobacterium sp. SYP-B4668 TaxID=2996035 RepID=UPI0022DE81E0|nr:hypothetical protein [Sphingobacterium sp. SYP-B4668]